MAAIVESSQDSIITIDFDLNITSWNKAAEDLYGYPAKEAIGKLLTTLTLPKDLQEVLRNVERIRTSKTVERFETVRVKKGGEQVLLEIVLSPVKDNTGRVIGVSTIARDLTERERARAELSESKAALRSSQERYRMLVESATDYAIFTMDENNIVTTWNVGAENIFGWKASEIIGINGAITFTPEDREAREPEKEMMTAARMGRAEDERWHQRKDGSLFFASGLMMPLRDGQPGYLKICRDQTAKAIAENAVRDRELLKHLVSTQEDERRRIARDIHDHLGQQLTALRLKLTSALEMCSEQKVCDQIEEVQKLASELDRDVDFLAWELRPASLDDLGLRVTLENFVREWERYTGIKADYHVSGFGKKRLPVEVETNLYRISQEALNNVLKHAKASRVSLLLEKRGNTISLIIEDDGIGFKKLSNRNKHLGMGLDGMRERAAIMGGTLEIETLIGKGTTLFVRVPAKLPKEKQ